MGEIPFVIRMSTVYTLEAGPQQGRIDASGNDGLGVYEIENGTVEVESYADAAALVDAFSHVRWIGDDPKPDESLDDAADADDSAVDDGDDTEADETTDDAASGAVDGGSEGDGDDEDADASDDGAVEALASMEYGDLQELAIAHDIKGNQSAEVLAETLAEMGVTADDA